MPTYKWLVKPNGTHIPSTERIDAWLRRMPNPRSPFPRNEMLYPGCTAHAEDLIARGKGYLLMWENPNVF